MHNFTCFDFKVDSFFELAGVYDAMASTSKNLFANPSSDTGDFDTTAPSTRGGGNGPSAYVDRADVDATWGPSSFGRVAKLLPFDTAAAYQDRPVGFSATYNKVMPAKDASAMVSALIRRCGAVGQVESVQLALVNAILLSHAKNSGSVIQPSRAVFKVNGGRELNFYEDVITVLGDDARRFFRAFADQTREVVRERITGYRAGDTNYDEDYRDIMMVAKQRGLDRYPDLIADSSEACSNLTRVESDAIGASKMSILSRTDNMADLVRNYRVKTASPSVPKAHDYAGPAGVQGPDY